MAKFIRKTEHKDWLENAALDDRVERGTTELEDPGGKPSVYIGDTENDRRLALAAQAWWRRGRQTEKIKRTRYVVINDEQISQAGLELVRTRSTIPWKRLRSRHYELTRHGGPCTESDLLRLVQILIDEGPEYGQIEAKVLKDIARIETTSNPFRRVFMRLRMWWGSR